MRAIALVSLALAGACRRVRRWHPGHGHGLGPSQAGGRWRGPGHASAGFFSVYPWLPHLFWPKSLLLDRAAGVALLAIGGWTIYSLLQAAGSPVLPSTHAVPVSLHASQDSSASGVGHLIWYRRGQLLVVSLEMRGLPSNREVTAQLLFEGSCAATQARPGVRLASARTDAQGRVAINAEATGISDMHFQGEALLVRTGRLVKACGEVALSTSSDVAP